MAGFGTVKDNNGNQIIDSQAVLRAHGLTAQSWNALAVTAGSLGNSNLVQAIVGPNPMDAAGHPGYLAPGQPGGANTVVIPNNEGNGAGGANLHTNAPNAGTAGGGGYYPAAAAGAVPNPFIKAGWHVQSFANEDAPVMQVAVGPQFTAVHQANTNNIFTPTITGGTGPFTVTVVEYLLNGAVQAPAMPSGLTLTPTTGAVANSVTSAAGTYQLGFRVADSSSPVRFATYEVTIVIT